MTRTVQRGNLLRISRIIGWIVLPVLLVVILQGFHFLQAEAWIANPQIANPERITTADPIRVSAEIQGAYATVVPKLLDEAFFLAIPGRRITIVWTVQLYKRGWLWFWPEFLGEWKVEHYAYMDDMRRVHVFRTEAGERIQSDVTEGRRWLWKLENVPLKTLPEQTGTFVLKIKASRSSALVGAAFETAWAYSPDKKILIARAPVAVSPPSAPPSRGKDGGPSQNRPPTSPPTKPSGYSGGTGTSSVGYGGQAPKASGYPVAKKPDGPNLTYTSDESTVLLLHLDEAEVANVLDASGYGNHGKAFGTQVVNGIMGKARSFNGRGDCVQISDSPSLDMSSEKQITVEVWIKIHSYPSGVGHIVAKWGTGSDYDDEWTLQLERGGKACFTVNSSTANWSPNTVLYSKPNLPLNQWIHLAGVWNGNQGLASLYVDGKMESSTSPVVRTIPHTNQPIRLGWDGAGGYFNGVIDEVRISNRALATAELNVAASAGEVRASDIDSRKSHLTALQLERFAELFDSQTWKSHAEDYFRDMIENVIADLESIFEELVGVPSEFASKYSVAAKPLKDLLRGTLTWNASRMNQLLEQMDAMARAEKKERVCDALRALAKGLQSGNFSALKSAVESAELYSLMIEQPDRFRKHNMFWTDNLRFLDGPAVANNLKSILLSLQKFLETIAAG
jgi:hypothetical protein